MATFCKTTTADRNRRRTFLSSRNTPRVRLGYYDAHSFRKRTCETRKSRSPYTINPAIVLAGPDLATIPVAGVLDVRRTRSLARKLGAALDLEVSDGGAARPLPAEPHAPVSRTALRSPARRGGVQSDN